MSEVGLEMLAEMVRRVLDGQRRLEEGQHDLIHRVGRIETLLADDGGAQAHLSVRLDRLSERVGKIEARLNLIDRFSGRRAHFKDEPVLREVGK